MNIEQRRRDFKAAEPQLYAYITHHEVARVLDSVGDTVSGLYGEAPANYLWGQTSKHKEWKANIARDENDE